MNGLLPEFSETLMAANDRFSDLFYAHLAEAIHKHPCAYEPGAGGSSCEICDVHIDSCPRCQELLDACLGLELLSGEGPEWLDVVDRARLTRIAHEILFAQEAA